MQEIAEIENTIETRWFANHKAHLIEHEGVAILDWKEPGTFMYPVRYIFAGSRLYISGDIGDAVFNLTWMATPESFNDVNLGYFLGKLSCNSRERWLFDERKALIDLEEWYEEAVFDIGEKVLKETNELYKDLKSIIRSVSTPKEYERELFNHYSDNSFIFYDAEDFSSFSEFGKKLPMVFVAYLLGIKLANKQINTMKK